MMLRAVLPVCLACSLQLAQAQTLDDPTRPPAALWAPATSVAAPARPARPQLQSVLISNKPGGRRLAVIDGQIVRQGSKVGDAEVVEIQEAAVVLRRGKTLETFKLYPGPKTVGKTDHKPGASTGRMQE